MKVYKSYGADEPRVCMHCGQGIYDSAEVSRLTAERDRLRALVREAAEVMGRLGCHGRVGFAEYGALLARLEAEGE